MDQSEIVVSFTLDAEEARRETAELQETGVTKAATDHLRGFGWFYVVGGCLSSKRNGTPQAPQARRRIERSGAG